MVLDVTAIDPSADGYLTVYGHGGARPGASNLDFHPGSNSANLTVTALPANGQLDFYNGSGGTVQLVADVAGYYLAGTPTAAGAFTALSTSRLLDTRGGLGTRVGAVAARSTISLQVGGHGGVPASGVAAIVLNVTVISPTSDGYLTLYGHGGAKPAASNLDFHPGRSVANLTVTALPANGQLDFYNGSGGTVQLVADVAGYYLAGTPTAAGAFTALPTSRLLDTRSGAGTPKAALPGNATLSLQVTGRDGIPTTGVAAVALNLTAISPSSAGYLTSYPGGTPQAHVSDLDFAAGTSRAILVLVPVGTDGSVLIRNGGTGTVQLVADVAGYYLGDPAEATVGSIAGQVTDAAKHPLANVLIDTTDPQTGTYFSAVSDSSGHYLLAGLLPGDVTVCFRPDQPGRPRATGGTSTTGYNPDCTVDSVTVTAGTTQTVPTFALSAAGAITGKVTDTAGHPLKGIAIESGSNGNYVQSTGVLTAADGSYRLSDLPSGPTLICFDGSSKTNLSPAGFQHQCYQYTDARYGDYPDHIGTPLNPLAGRTIGYVNARLDPAAGADGRVTDPAGHPVVGVMVDAYPVGSGRFISTTTRSDGSYTLSGLAPGKYSICFYPYQSSSASQGYVFQCYHEGFPYSSPNLTLAGGILNHHIDAQLNRGGSIAVTVTDAHGHPLQDAEVDIDGRNIVDTSAAGTVRVDRIEAGSHSLCFFASGATGGDSTVGYADQCYLNRSLSQGSSGVTVTAGAVTSITVVLASAASIQVTVTDPNGQPIGGVKALAFPPDGGSSEHMGTSDAQGHLVIPQLTGGNYMVCLEAGGTDGAGAGITGVGAGGGFQDRCGTQGSNAVPVVTVRDYQQSSLVAVLQPLAGIGGVVKDGDGNPLSGVTVMVRSLSPGDSQTVQVQTGGDGSYRIPRLTDPSYSVCFYANGQFSSTPVGGGDSTTGYANGCFDKATESAPTPVSAAPGTLTTVNSTLAYGGVITGTIVDDNGAPVAGVEVSTAYGIDPVVSKADGSYRFDSLAAGQHSICAEPGQNPHSPHGYGFLAGCYSSAVTAAHTTTTDITLAEAGAISGTVTDDLGNPLSAEGQLFGDGNTVQDFNTAADGTWQVTGLQSGTYRVCFTGPDSPDGTRYESMCYDSKGPGLYGTPITVTEGTASSGIDQKLPRLATISGRVQDTSGQGVPVPISVLQNGNYVRFAMSNDDGSFTIGSLPAGTYSVYFQGDGYGYQNRYYHDVLPDGTPTPVTVVAGSKLTGVDQTLPAASNPAVIRRTRIGLAAG